MDGAENNHSDGGKQTPRDKCHMLSRVRYPSFELLDLYSSLGGVSEGQEARPGLMKAGEASTEEGWCNICDMKVAGRVWGTGAASPTVDWVLSHQSSINKISLRLEENRKSEGSIFSIESPSSIMTLILSSWKIMNHTPWNSFQIKPNIEYQTECSFILRKKWEAPFGLFFHPFLKTVPYSLSLQIREVRAVSITGL